MEILYRQTQTERAQASDALTSLGIERCYLKHLSHKTDRISVTRKGHHHTGFELHLVENGNQAYEISSEVMTVGAGELLLIPPLVTHTALYEDIFTEKYAITFGIAENSVLSHSCANMRKPISASIPCEIRDSICAIESERHKKEPYGSLIIANRVLECILIALRIAGLDEQIECATIRDEDARLMMAKQYIHDNICRPVTLSEVACYCCISEKQLTRIFKLGEGVTVTEYIRRQRCLYIEKLLCDRALSLREISEIMNFSSEYYFNAVFKKHSGMSPGAYRRSIFEGR